MATFIASAKRAHLLVVCIGSLAVASGAQAASVVMHRNDVVPVHFDRELSSTENREGDRFSATVNNDRIFPSGTKFEGHITRIERKEGRHPASMDLVFDKIELPNGDHTDIDGAPIPLDSKYVNQDRDGHYTAKSSVGKDTAVGIGAIGGFILGSILHKPFEGTFVGILAGIAVAETAGNGDDQLVIHRDAKAGVLFRRECRVDVSDNHDSRPSRDDHRDDHRDDRRDDSRGGGIAGVQIGDKMLDYRGDVAPYDGPSAVMLPIEVTAKQLGYSYDVADDRIYVENDNHSLRLVKGDRSYRLDGQAADMSGIVEERNGVLYAPADVFGNLLGKKVSVRRNGTGRA